MARWKPDAVGRLSVAALELFGERGFDATTVADIAERAELTERTFFRYFADKREVLFSGSEMLLTIAVQTVKGAPASDAPFDVALSAIEAAAVWIEERAGHEPARARYRVVMATTELRERELIKMASLAAAIAEALHARGVAEPAASLVAHASTAVFHVGFARWIADDRGRPIAQHMRAAAKELRAQAAPAAPSAAAATTKPVTPKRRSSRSAR